MGLPRFRDVRFEPTWEEDLARLRGGSPAPAPIDEVVGELSVILGSLADTYPTVGGTPFRKLDVVSARGLPALTAWFRIENDECVACYHLDEVTEEAEEDVEIDDPEEQGL